MAHAQILHVLTIITRSSIYIGLQYVSTEASSLWFLSCATFIVQENNSESKAFQKHFSDLYESAVANPVLLCVKLYSADVISQEMKRKFSDMTVREDQALELLNASERMIKLDPKKFYSFVTELKKIDEPLGKKLLNTCGKLHNNNNQGLGC